MYRVSYSVPGAAVAEERSRELELGLSIRGRRGRILTAEDFPSLWLRDSAISSNSSVSSSSSGLGDEEDSGSDCAGNNRGADGAGLGASQSPYTTSQSQVVGWPPIRSCRRNNMVSISRVANSNNVNAYTHKEVYQRLSNIANGGIDDESKSNRVGKSHFVKVNMDGDLIGRKVDLHTYASYETLAFALETMFHKPTLSINASTAGMFAKQLDGSSEFVLVYEDEDGDWMLVGDVPWGMFVRIARRLRIMKSMDACGLGMSSIEI